MMNMQHELRTAHTVICACIHQDIIMLDSSLSIAAMQQRLKERCALLCSACLLEERYTLACSQARKRNLKHIIGTNEHQMFAEIIRSDLFDLYVTVQNVQDQSTLVRILNRSRYRQSLFWMEYRTAQWDKHYQNAFCALLQSEISNGINI